MPSARRPDRATVRTAARSVDAGRSAVSFRDGQTEAHDAFGTDERARLAELRRRFDPDGVFRTMKALG